MHLVTTARFHLVAALVAACTCTVQGFAIAAILVCLELLRILARHYLNRSTVGSVPPAAVYATSDQAAITRVPVAR